MDDNKEYGQLPVEIDNIPIKCNEIMCYQYMPIKLANKPCMTGYVENRLWVFNDLIVKAITDYISKFGEDNYNKSYIYLTVKHRYQSKESPLNRLGYHSDGFGTDDINYIWYDKNPTIFNSTHFRLSNDHNKSLQEMEYQALKWLEKSYPVNTLLRLNQYCIHKVNDSVNIEEGMRTFVKVSFSKDKYDLIGNTHNYKLDYNWDMKPRNKDRNVPQSIIS